jgi:splicing factor U2AF subunit
MELAKFGELEELNVCDNIGEHLIGNVYVKYQLEEDADKAFKGLKGRYYSGKPI